LGGGILEEAIPTHANAAGVGIPGQSGPAFVFQTSFTV